MKRDHWNLFKRISLLTILAALFLSCNVIENTSVPTVAPEILAESNVIKLKITGDGMYRQPLSDLGWDEKDLETIAITHKDKEIPLWINRSDPEVSVIFYGQSSTSPYSPDNFYMIHKNVVPTQTIERANVLKPNELGVDYLLNTIRIEENHVYSPRVKNDSPWHWLKIVAPQSHTFDIELPGATGGPGNLRVVFWGVTTAPTRPAHHILVSINGEMIGEATWDGQTWFTLETPINAGILVEGGNTIEIQGIGEVEALIDIINLDWIEIEYQKKSVMLEPQEFFNTPEKAVQLTGLNGPLTIFDISNTSEVLRYHPPSNHQESFNFQGDKNLSYIAVAINGYYHPEEISQAAISPDLRAESGASYIVVGHPELIEPLEPLLKERTDQGLSTLSIPVEAIYDQFNDGMPEPQAIQKFLQYAVENWKTPPKYLLLVGDTSYDFHGYQTPIENQFVPTIMVNTTFGGETGSDVIIAQINDDQWPDISIGRVPARTTQQVETFVAKTLSFEENSPSSDWNSSILAIADGQEPTFKADAEHFILKFPGNYQTHLIAPEAGTDGTNQQIAAEIKSGQLLTAYFGHGSINMWGKDSLFTTEDSAKLNNAERLTVVLNFTCLTGLFTHPTEESLAESLLFNPEGGAVAVLAPTSPTLPTDQSFLTNAFIEAMLQEPASRLGDITLAAWRKVPTYSESSLDVMQTFLLFGDPTLLMPNP